MKSHGTTTRYKQGCRCLQCRAANTAYHRHRRLAGTGSFESERTPWEPVNGMLPVLCWCQRRVVDVPVEDVQALRTKSCGHQGCVPWAEARLA